MFAVRFPSVHPLSINPAPPLSPYLPHMLIYAGIDEAGYGPMLGPLCIAATVFALPDHDPAAGAPNLWSLLDSAVCRKRNDKRNRIAVDDSKLLKGAKDAAAHPLRHLERGVLAFHHTVPISTEDQQTPTAAPAAKQHVRAEQWGGGGVATIEAESRPSQCRLPEIDCDLFAHLGCTIPDHAWCCSETPLPVANTRDELAIASNRLAAALNAANARTVHLACTTIHACEFNRQVERMHNKAAINFCAIARLIDHIWRQFAPHHPRIIVDRQGGRTQYLDLLQLSWPEARIQIVAEDDRLSRYRLDDHGSCLTITFQTEAETAHLPVALASMTAKYVRELFMLRFNRYFTSHLPTLSPTAGYVQDARRYLADINPLIAKLRIKRTDLIRSI